MKTKFFKLFIVMTISITALFVLGMTASAATECNINEGFVFCVNRSKTRIVNTVHCTTNKHQTYANDYSGDKISL